MKASFLCVIGFLFLSACSSTDQNTSIEYLNLIGDKEAVLNYWLVNRKIAANYPLQAKSRMLAGCVEFSLVIASNGRARNPKVIKSFPAGIFDKEAIKAIKKWKWVAAPNNAHKQPVATTIQHDFTLRNARNGDEAYASCKI